MGVLTRKFSSNTTNNTDTNAAIPTKSITAEQRAVSNISGKPRRLSLGMRLYIFFAIIIFIV